MLLLETNEQKRKEHFENLRHYLIFLRVIRNKKQAPNATRTDVLANTSKLSLCQFILVLYLSNWWLIFIHFSSVLSSTVFRGKYLHPDVLLILLFKSRYIVQKTVAWYKWILLRLVKRKSYLPILNPGEWVSEFIVMYHFLPHKRCAFEFSPQHLQKAQH